VDEVVLGQAVVQLLAFLRLVVRQEQGYVVARNLGAKADLPRHGVLPALLPGFQREAYSLQAVGLLNLLARLRQLACSLQHELSLDLFRGSKTLVDPLE
jgi:hypothetical protein